MRLSGEAHARIKCITHPVTKKIKREYRDKDRESRKRCDEPVREEVGLPSPNIVPHSGVGGLTPSPRKPRPAAVRIAVPTWSVDWTMTGARQLRRICSLRMRDSGAPSYCVCATGPELWPPDDPLWSDWVRDVYRTSRCGHQRGNRARQCQAQRRTYRSHCATRLVP